MKVLKLALLTLTICLLIAGCKKENQSIGEGTYTGTFKVVYPSGTYTGQTSLELKGSGYHCTGNFNKFPAGGSGLYSIYGDKVVFKDENFWTANFDPALILDGEYDYSFDGHTLKLSKKIGNAYYEYIFQKQISVTLYVQ